MATQRTPIREDDDDDHGGSTIRKGSNSNAADDQQQQQQQQAVAEAEVAAATGFVAPSSYLRMHASRDVAGKSMPSVGRGSMDLEIADREQWDALVRFLIFFFPWLDLACVMLWGRGKSKR